MDISATSLSYFFEDSEYAMLILEKVGGTKTTYLTYMGLNVIFLSPTDCQKVREHRVGVRYNQGTSRHFPAHEKLEKLNLYSLGKGATSTTPASVVSGRQLVVLPSPPSISSITQETRGEQGIDSICSIGGINYVTLKRFLIRFCVRTFIIFARRERYCDSLT